MCYILLLKVVLNAFWLKKKTETPAKRISPSTFPWDVVCYTRILYILILARNFVYGFVKRDIM